MSGLHSWMGGSFGAWVCHWVHVCVGELMDGQVHPWIGDSKGEESGATWLVMRRIGLPLHPDAQGHKHP